MKQDKTQGDDYHGKLKRRSVRERKAVLSDRWGAKLIKKKKSVKVILVVIHLRMQHKLTAENIIFMKMGFCTQPNQLF